jgi:hypothetical protein
MNHFVYLYRDVKRRPRYVGYGADAERAFSHLLGTHNEGLEELIESGSLSLEIAGPFDDENTARAVETALISCLAPTANIARGEARHRFRPLGVPEAFAARFAEPPLQRDELLRRAGPFGAGVLCVKISRIDFEEENGVRRGYDPTRPGDDSEILGRVVQWWPLDRWIPQWMENPERGPGLLLGIYGAPGAQIVVASLLVDRANWKCALRSNAKVRVPALETPALDAGQLRGRRLDAAAGLKFGAWTHQHARLLLEDDAPP